MHIFSLRARRQAARPMLVLSILLSPSIALADNNDSHAHEHRHEDHGVAETIVVTGTPLEHDRDEVAIPVDVVDRSELLEHLGPPWARPLRAFRASPPPVSPAVRAVP